MWPAPEEAESKRTRGLRVICCGSERRKIRTRMAQESCRFPGAGGEFFQNAAGDFLRLAESGKIILELVIDGFGVLDAELVAEDHVAKLDGMWEEGFFLQFFESGGGVVVIHINLLLRAPAKGEWRNDCTHLQREKERG